MSQPLKVSGSTDQELERILRMEKQLGNLSPKCLDQVVVELRQLSQELQLAHDILEKTLSSVHVLWQSLEVQQ